jgi:hypothetical protein
MKLQLGDTDREEMKWEIDAELAELEFEWGPIEFEIEVGGDIEIEVEFTTSG